jgi:TolB-like protein
MGFLKNFTLSYFLLSFVSSSLMAYEYESLYRDNTASYISKITKSIAKQYEASKNIALLQKKSIIITPSVDSSDRKTTLPITQRIDENLIYEMAQAGFHIVDYKSLNFLENLKRDAEYILVSTFTNYKHEMVINSRIIDKKTGLVYATAQVQVPRRVLKDVDKLYNKNSWFSPTE